jgi:hypothetical protein
MQFCCYRLKGLFHDTFYIKFFIYQIILGDKATFRIFAKICEDVRFFDTNKGNPAKKIAGYWIFFSFCTRVQLFALIPIGV